jgi:hypothetical protein
MSLIAYPLLIALAALGLAVQAAAADPIPYPDEYIGIWDITTVVRDCETQIILFQSTDRDTVCAGELFDPEFGEAQLTCTGEITQTTINLECTGSYEVEPGCIANITFTMTGTLNGDTQTTTTTIVSNYVGATCVIPSSCMSITSTGTRVNPDPGDCPPSPVEPATWGQLKQRYE